MLKRWTGTGAFNTEPFTVQFSPFAISWASTPTQGAGSFFQANLFDSTAAPILAITNTTVREASSTYVYRSGTFYIAVNAANTQWALEIWGYT